MLRDQLRQAVADSGERQAAIARACKLTPSSLSRFLSATGGLSLDAAERLANHLRLRLMSETSDPVFKRRIEWEAE